MDMCLLSEKRSFYFCCSCDFHVITFSLSRYMCDYSLLSSYPPYTEVGLRSLALFKGIA